MCCPHVQLSPLPWESKSHAPLILCQLVCSLRVSVLPLSPSIIPVCYNNLFLLFDLNWLSGFWIPLPDYLDWLLVYRTLAEPVKPYTIHVSLENHVFGSYLCHCDNYSKASFSISLFLDSIFPEFWVCCNELSSNKMAVLRHMYINQQAHTLMMSCRCIIFDHFS